MGIEKIRKIVGRYRITNDRCSRSTTITFATFIFLCYTLKNFFVHKPLVFIILPLIKRDMDTLQWTGVLILNFILGKYVCCLWRQ